MEILRLRDQVFPEPAKRKEFDDAYEFVLMEVLNVRTTAQNVAKLWDEHSGKGLQGQIARMQRRSIRIDESIDKRAAEQGGSVPRERSGQGAEARMQKLMKMFGVDIGFLFQKQSSFRKRVEGAGKTRSCLADYLKQVRLSWSEHLLDQRNAIEHEGWQLPKIRYSVTAGALQAEEPEISRQKARIRGVHAGSAALLCGGSHSALLAGEDGAGMSVTEVPLAQRTTDAPGRFRLTPITGGMPVWRMNYRPKLLWRGINCSRRQLARDLLQTVGAHVDPELGVATERMRPYSFHLDPYRSRRIENATLNN